jgi:SAM-dependent methyltransferase
VNVEQKTAWDGTDGDTWTDNESFYNEAARHLTPHLLEAAAFGPADRVLDVGCGCGETTRAAARAAAGGGALGIDLSSRMIERARERAAAEGLANARFERGDAQVHPFEPESFDAAISRFGVMFFDDPVGAFTNVAGALARGGRLAMLCWNELRRNEWVSAIRSALAAGRDLPEPPQEAPGPFSLAAPDRVRSILESAGFSDVHVDRLDEPMYMGSDAARAFDSVKRLGIVSGLLGDLDEGTRVAALGALRQMIADHETPDGVLFGSSSWLVRAVRAH